MKEDPVDRRLRRPAHQGLLSMEGAGVDPSNDLNDRAISPPLGTSRQMTQPSLKLQREWISFPSPAR